MTVFEGFPVILRAKNVGETPIELQDLESEDLEWGIWISDICPPCVLNPGDPEIEIRRAHAATSGQAGRLSLRSTTLPVEFFFRVRPVPNIVLVNDRGKTFHHGTSEPQLCPMDESRGRTNLSLKVEGALVLDGPPRLEPSREVIHLEGMGLVSEYPLPLTSGEPLDVSVIRVENLPDEGYSTRLIFLFQNLGDVVFNLQLRYARTPVLRVWFDPPAFTGDAAIVSGTNKPQTIRATITHLGGAPLRIVTVTCNQKWLTVTDPDQIQNVILNPTAPGSAATEENERTIHLRLETMRLPRVEEQTTFPTALVIRGEAIGEEEPFEHAQNLTIVVRPPQKLDFPIAVDFGTTNSCVAYVDPTGSDEMPVLVELNQDDMPFEHPTAFQFLAIAQPTDRLELLEELKVDERRLPAGPDREAIMRFGNSPYERIFSEDDIAIWRNMPTICWSFKRFLAQPKLKFVYTDFGMGNLLLNAIRYYDGNRHIEIVPVDQVAIYLRFLLARFREETGYLPRDIIFTYPAVFNRQKDALRKAAEQATQGMDVQIHLDISEPEAIAVYHVWQMVRQQVDLSEELIIGVFDCGGGSTDISIVRFAQKGKDEFHLEILASDGDNLLGGDMLSFRIAEYLYCSMVPERYRNQFPFAKDLQEGLHTQDRVLKFNFLRLYQLAEKIKTNSTKHLEWFDACFDNELYETLRANRDRGVLDLLFDENVTVYWPRVQLRGREPGRIFDVERATRTVDGQELPDKLGPMDPQTIREAIRKELARGFNKLIQMQQALYDRSSISGFLLDRLILAGNSFKLPLVEEVAKDMIQAREITFPSLEDGKERGLKISVAVGAAIYGTTKNEAGMPLQVFGVHKLNYPIGTHNQFTGFRPVFERWIPLEPGHPVPYQSMRWSFRKAPNKILLYEFFDWDYHKGLSTATGRKVADISVPMNDERFAHARFWQYALQLRCDTPGRAKLFYNFAMGMEEDGSDFEYLWPEFKECEGFIHS